MTDRDVYLKLAALAEELARLAAGAETLVGEAALLTAADALSGSARAVYEHCLNGEDLPH